MNGTFDGLADAAWYSDWLPGRSAARQALVELGNHAVACMTAGSTAR